MSNDKMVILLIDDDPTFSDHKGKVALKYGCDRRERYVLDENFELLWLRGMYEAKTYYDGVRALKEINPKSLLELGVVPDIVVFDYCLTRSKSRTGSRQADPTNPCVPIYAKVREHRPSFRDLPAALRRRPNKNVSRSGNDRYGQIAGTALVAFFDDYVTHGLPTTAHADIAESPDEAGYIEWWYEDQMTFPETERTEQAWGQLLYESLREVRQNLKDRVTDGRIEIDLSEIVSVLDTLKSAPINYQSLAELSFQVRYSLYGPRRYQLSALYYDHFFDRTKTLFDGTKSGSCDVDARDSELIVEDLEELLKCGLNGSISNDEYAESLALCKLYIDAALQDQPITQPFLTNRRFSSARQGRLLVLGMVLWLRKTPYRNSRDLFKREIRDVFFSGQNSENIRKARSRAQVSIDSVLEGKTTSEHARIIARHSGEVHDWPHWWKLRID